jgi:uncharacterized protein (UPF0332 family)
MKHESADIISNHVMQASRLLEESRLLLEAGFFNGSLNRSYYSIYNSVKALLELKNVETKSHAGVLTMFHDHYVRTGDFPRKDLENLQKSEVLREKSDYKNFYAASQEDAQEQLTNAAHFLRAASRYIEKKLGIRLIEKDIP